jgi:hypothetical protein
MEETLTLTRLGIRGNLSATLESTTPCESMIEIVRRTQRNVGGTRIGLAASRGGVDAHCSRRLVLRAAEADKLSEAFLLLRVDGHGG